MMSLFDPSMKVTKFICAALVALMCGCAVATEGSIDTSYGVSGVAIASLPGSVDNRARDIAVLSDGSSLVVGRCLIETIGYQHCVTRFSTTGMVDVSYANGTGQLRLAGSDGQDNYRIVALGDGGALIAFGCGTGICVERINATGALDPTFGVAGVATIPWLEERTLELSDMFVGVANQIFVSFRCETQSYDLRFCVAKLAADGAMLNAYGTSGVRVVSLPAALQVRASGTSAALSDGGRLLAGICSTFSQGNSFLCAARIDEIGGDAALFLAQHESGQVLPITYPKQHWFVNHGPQNLVQNFGASASQDRFGSLLVTATCANANYDPCVYRFLPTGRSDALFGTGGGVSIPMGDGDDIASLHLLDDDKLLLIGSCWRSIDIQPSQIYRTCSARLSTSGMLDATYGDNGIRRDMPTLPSGARGDVGGRFQHAADGSFVGIGEVWIDTQEGARFATTKLNTFAASSANCALNADSNLIAAPSTDVLLTIRYLLGFQGEALTNGAIGQNATRTADEIVTYLDSLKNDPMKKLDLDGDGESLALTDGLLMLRAMLGLSGEALTVGAMGQTSVAYPTLRSPQQILQWIESTHGVACLP